LKKFEDSINTAVFTTTFVIKGRKDITYVTHEIENGAWQFFSSDTFDNYEDVATRQSVRDRWTTKKL